ncbi:ADP-ribosylation factor GTPase-activating protein GCS1 [Erysiphe necator]|nr:ADP-ribosylation factor GTPase-activating protein GCS1 [Erysiphe necator]
MASRTIWEVDPETRSKLLEIQKTKSNDRCCDCEAPSPQWASPKFGIFICLSCAGIHRGLGVHISFVRSISMDAFKSVEIERMRLGGNKSWRDFFEQAESNKKVGITWDDASISERYSGEVGEEWKERLSAKVEGREYDPSAIKRSIPISTSQSSKSNSPTRSQTLPSYINTHSTGPGSKVKVDNKYFEDLGAKNATRSTDLPPSQGGKYCGFGSQPLKPSKIEPRLPGLEDIQKDPVAALTKSLSWFSTTMGRTAKTVNEDYIQPTAKSVVESDIAAHARLAATQVVISAQTGAKSAATNITRYVEGNKFNKLGNSGGQYRRTPLDNENKLDYWEEFGDIDNRGGIYDANFKGNIISSNSVGTNAIKKASGVGVTSRSRAGTNSKKNVEMWES